VDPILVRPEVDAAVQRTVLGVDRVSPRHCVRKKHTGSMKAVGEAAGLVISSGLTSPPIGMCRDKDGTQAASNGCPARGASSRKTGTGRRSDRTKATLAHCVHGGLRGLRTARHSVNKRVRMCFSRRVKQPEWTRTRGMQPADRLAGSVRTPRIPAGHGA
jgi:hypothetical protein